MKKSVLVIVAHPDDEVLGCGGTIARLAREGCRVTVAILGEGVASRFSSQAKSARLIKKLHADSAKAIACLGARPVIYGKFPDNRFDSLPLLDVVKQVEALIEEHSPDAVYTSHGGDLNVDHAVVHRAVLTATRPLKGTRLKEVFAFEIPSSTEWAFGRLEQPFRPNVFVDISATLDDKLSAMRLYRDELREFPHPRSPQALSAIAHRWGSVAGMNAAEAFEAVRILR